MTPAARPRSHARTARRLRRASGPLATRALARMETELPWFADLPADQRSWVGLLVQNGLAGFADWVREPQAGARISTDVFATAPRELARLISLQHTVELVRIAAQTAEDAAEEVAEPGEEVWLREAALRFAGEIAFAAAMVYARAAEQRGAWDARLEALVVDAVLRGEPDESLLSRASALGWPDPPTLAVLAGASPPGAPEAVLETVHARAGAAAVPVLAGVQGHRLVAVVGGGAAAGPALLGVFGPGPVVAGRDVPTLGQAWVSGRDALSALRAAPGWPGAPRLVPAAALLPERAIAGDERACGELVEEFYRPLRESGPALLATLDAYLGTGGSLEASARALFVHPNTVRYRLGRVAEICGISPMDPRGFFVLQVALVAGRLTDGEPGL